MKKLAFTMSEFLITLGVIGVVAAIVIPNSIYNYKKIKTAAKLKQTYSIISQGFEMAKKDHGDIEIWDFSSQGYGSSFINTYLLPYVKNRPCTYSENQIQTGNGNFAINTVWVNPYMRCLENGASVVGHTTGSNGRFSQVIYVDINGPQKPNVFGRDIFSLHFSNPNLLNDGYYAPNCPKGLSFCKTNEIGKNVNKANPTKEVIYSKCLANGGNRGYNTCGYIIQQNNWKIPDDYPIKL